MNKRFELESLEQALREHAHTIEANIPKIERLEKLNMNRTRSRKGFRLLFASCALIGMGLASWMALKVPYFSDPIAQSQRVDTSSTGNAIAPTEVRIGKESNNPIASQPFQVYATWRVPVLVKHSDPDGMESTKLEFLEVRRPVDPKNLDRSELRLIRHLLPDNSQLSTQL